MKLIALYKTPPDPQAFDDAYFNTHLPLIDKVPGLNCVNITRFTRTLVGDGLYLMAEMEFNDESAMKSALRSPEMAAASANLNTFADGLTTLMFGVEHERPVARPG